MGEDFVVNPTTGYSEGKWMAGKYTDDDLRYNDHSYCCSRCGKIVDFAENYCPNCGAKMAEEE
jgi:rubrerythrin